MAQPRLRDIAAALGISAATVSNALGRKGRVSQALAERIRSEARRQGYAPGGPGRALRTGRSGVFGLVVPDLSNPLFPRMAQALEREIAAAGYGMLIADSHGDSSAQDAAIVRLQQRGAEGVVLVPRRGTRIADPGIPLAVIDTPSTPGNTVSADHFQGGAAVGAHLMELGHRRILFLGDSVRSPVQIDRIAGLRSALRGGAVAETAWLETGGTEACAGAARRGVTAIATTSDLVALRALGALDAAGIDVPGQVALSGFDDLVFAPIMRPPLTTVIADHAAIATHAVAALVAQIEGRDAPSEARVAMTLIPRASTLGARPIQQELTTC